MANPCILFIENEWKIKKKWILNLTSEDYEVIPTESLFNAQRLLRSATIQLIICSQHLPDGDVTDFLNLLRSSQEFSELPLVVLASENEQDPKKFIKFGATEVVSANLAKDQFMRIVKKQIQLHLPDIQQSVTGITGQLHKLSITDLIFELAQRHGSGKITIDGNEEMSIYLKEGKIIHSQHGITVGKKALFRCLRIADAAYRFQRNINNVKPTIEDAELDHLIREAGMSNQKLMVNFHLFPSKYSRIKLLSTKGLDAKELTPKVKAALEIIRRYPLVNRFLDHLNLPDIACFELLQFFKEHGVVEFFEKEKPTTILVDNSCDLSPLDFTKHKVSVLPLNLKTETELVPNRSVHSKNFHKFTRREWDLASIVPFTKEGFTQCFSTLNKEYEILTMVPSPKLLPTAKTIQPFFNEIRKEGLEGEILSDFETSLYTSRTFSVGYGLLTIRASQLAAEDMPVEMLTEKLRYLEERLQFLWIDNQSGGGILGKNQQQILFRWNGEEVSLERKLNKDESSLDVFRQEIDKRLDVKSSLHIAVGSSHTGQTQVLKEFMEKEYIHANIYGLDVTPVNMKITGTHIQMVAFLQG